MSNEQDAEIVRLAVQAAGVADKGWNERVVGLVPRIAALFREPNDEADPNALVNVARKVAESHVFRAEYRGHDFDDNTKRVFVKLYDEKGQGSDHLDEDGCQTVRTEPMWSATGRSLRKILEGCEPGQMVVCYRYTEQIDKTRKMGLLTHVEPLRRTRPEGAQQSPPAAAQPPVRQGEGSGARPEPSADSAGPTEEQAQLANSIDQLNNKQKVQFVRACRADDIPNPWEASATEIPIVRRHLEEARNS